MAKIIAFIALCLTATLGSPIEPRIVGGSTVDISYYPFMAAVLFTPDGSIYHQSCGSTIINNRSVLTAAHCLVGSTSQYRIRAGSSYSSSGGSLYNVADMILHPDYNIVLMNHDIALMRITGAFMFGNNIQVARIGGYNIGDNEIVWAAGWGLTSFNGSPSEELRHVQIWTVSQQTCASVYGSGFITDYMLCAVTREANNGVCNRDSGGPLIHNGVIVGVVSFGQNCGHPDYPAVYARVSKYTDWIQLNA